jgi:hypothetical protein
LCITVTIYKVNEAEGGHARFIGLVVDVWSVYYPMGTPMTGMNVDTGSETLRTKRE